MFEYYEEAINWIHSRLKFGVKPGLKRMEWLLERLNHPERKVKAIHVAGTNGKGSTISYMLHMLLEAGYKVGSFTSPYIETFNERISLNGKPITDQEMLELVNEIRPLVEEIEKTELGGPTEFEIITTMMFLYFGKKNQPDLLLLETGLGGRLDSTNIIEPILTIITNVGFDHMNILGSSISEIASEKAGIIKHGIPIITAAENSQAIKVINDTAKLNSSEVFRLNKEICILDKCIDEQGEVFSIDTSFHTYKDLKISMKGSHQIKNAALAITAINYLQTSQMITMNEQQIRLGLQKTKWKGRFEFIHNNPLVVLDGAHNKEGIESLLETVKRHYTDKHIHIVFSALKDKEYDEMIERLSNIATTMHFTTFDFPRAEAAYELYSVCAMTEKSYNDSWETLVENLLVTYKDSSEDLIVITGSLYFISEIRQYFIGENDL